MIPARSTLNSIRPDLISLTARSMSNVTVPDLGFGMRPRGPSFFPSRPTVPIMSGVAMATSNSNQPASMRFTRSSPPTSSAPARSASCAFSPWANTITRLVLPVPWGRTTVPRTSWSAWRGSTPSRRCASTVPSNLLMEIFGSSSEASPISYRRSGSTSFAASRYFFPCFGMSGHLDPHRARGALDDLHCLVDVVRVEVGHLHLRDLAHLRAGNPADLVLVRNRRSGLDARRALQKGGCKGSLRDEGEAAVLEDGDLGRNDVPAHVGGPLVERLDELHDVDAVLAEGRADGWRCGGSTG